MLYILSLCTILPEPLRSTAPHQLCHVRHVRFGLLMTSLMLPHCLLIPRACCDPIATCCAACDAAAANALPCDAQTRCELRIQLRTCGTLCANCASTPLHSSHFPYALPQHHLPLQDPGSNEGSYTTIRNARRQKSCPVRASKARTPLARISSSSTSGYGKELISFGFFRLGITESASMFF